MQISEVRPDKQTKAIEFAHVLCIPDHKTNNNPKNVVQKPLFIRVSFPSYGVAHGLAFFLHVNGGAYGTLSMKRKMMTFNQI